MGFISKKTIDDVFAAAQVDEVISDFMTLKKKGANYEGLCPFHNEKTPSFKVNPTKGIYKCFGCGRAGGPLQFVMEHENMSYPDAIRYLANKYGIDVVEDNSKQSEEYDELTKKKNSLFAAINYAQIYFKESLDTDEGKIAGLSYLKERGFTAETIEKFGLGYAPAAYSQFAEQALRIGVNEDALIDVGLIKKSDKGGHYDFFRDRVMFPFYDVAGRIIAFGGRILKKNEKAPKYLNSPESLVYIKSNTLYGIFQAKREIKKQDSCFLVEGYVDVLSLHQAGIENVVASSGTSLTENQARLIHRFTDNVTLLYDGDFAGIKASLRGIDILLEQGLNVRIIPLGEGEDPDDFVKNKSIEEVNEHFEKNIKDFIIFKSEFLYNEAANDPIKKAEANSEIIKSIALIPDPLKRAQYVQEFGKISGLDDTILQAELIKARKTETDRQIKSLSDELSFIQKERVDVVAKVEFNTQTQENAVAKILIKYGDLPYNDELKVAEFILSELEKDEVDFQSETASKIYHYAIEKIEEDAQLDFNSLMLKSSPDISNFIAQSIDDKYVLSKKWAEEEIDVPLEEHQYRVEAFNSVMHLKRMRLKMVMNSLMTELKDDIEPEDKLIILRQIMELQTSWKLFGQILKIAVI